MKIHLARFVFSMLLIAGSSVQPASAGTYEYWVAPNGADDHSGTKARPLASISAALQKWSESPRLESSATGDSLRVVLRGGLYPLAKTLSIGADGFNLTNNSVSIEAAPGEQPVLSGAVEVGHWERPAVAVPGLPEIAQSQVWEADVPKVRGHKLLFRQLWLDDAKATLAREPRGERLARLVAWDKTRQVAAIPSDMLASITNPDQLEMVVDQVWEIAILRVKTMQVLGTNELLTFKQPESDLEFKHPWPPVIVNAKYHAPFYLQNAVGFLDSPGEWFEDMAAGKIYYWPRPGEDMTRVHAYAPVLETLVQVEGDLAGPVNHIHFKGLAFSHSTWLRPSSAGHVPLQAGMFMFKTQKLSPPGTPYHPGLDNLDWIGRPPAAVCVRNATDVSFENCSFEHLASAGLDLQSGVRASLVRGCRFEEIGGNGLQMGMFSDPTMETHIPYNPLVQRELCQDDAISDNVFAECGTEDWGCVGIVAGYVRQLSIEHNDLSNLPYSGISVGWGWTKMTNAMADNAIIANHVHQVGTRLGDLGGIYTLSAQPGTVIAGNSVENIQPSVYVPDSKHWFYLYTDEGSSGITVRDNWCPAAKFLKNANGPGNVWTNNGPEVSEHLKNAAGLEPDYQYLLK